MLVRIIRALFRPPRRGYSTPDRRRTSNYIVPLPSRKRQLETPKRPPQAKPQSFDPTTARPQPQRQIISGPAYVVDGDTITVRKVQIRLFGIDAPEMNHPYGRVAKNAMYKLCKNQTVHAEILEVDNHGRTVAKCRLDDGRDLSAELVKQGLALDWPKFSGGIYKHLERPEARKKLWLADARQKGRMYLWYRFDFENERKGNSAWEQENAVGTEQATTATPDLSCPNCGAKMVVRPNGKTGVKFWGCSRFPKCRGSRDFG